MKTIKGMWLHLLQLTILIFITAASSAQLHADFSANQVTGCPALPVSFKDNSTGNPTSWKWDLGNGTTSSVQNPGTTYFTPGRYTVKLVVSNADGKDSIVKSEYIVVNALPTAYFGASDSTGCFPLKVQFRDSSLAGSGQIEKWQWDFGDGNLSAEQNPEHTYTSPGTFTVVLKVTNSNGCSAVYTKPSFITISDGVKADFSYISGSGCQIPAPVNFINSTLGTGSLTYLWDFGDGQTSTAANPTNNYKPGTYTVKLVATNSFGCADSVTKPNVINVGVLRADFSSPASACQGEGVQLTNTSTPATFTSVRWDFGDGSSSTQTNPVKTYTAPGTYQIKLVTVVGACSDSTVKTITVFAKPTAAFTSTLSPGCTGPLMVSFQDASTNATSYLWSFGDGASSTLQNPTHSYTVEGDYTVSLTVTNADGCSATLVKQDLVKFPPLKIKSIGNLGVKGCLPITVSPAAVILNNYPVTYSWDFGDGTKSTDAAPSHTYTSPGIYDVKLVITTAEGCTDSYVYKEAVKAGSKPVTQFSANPRDVCASMPVTFSDLSTNGPVDEWLWYFGDGGTSGQQNPTYTYNDTGYFNVTLITSNFGCADTLKRDKFIHIKPPIAKFDTSFLCNDPLKRIFINKSIGATAWDWDFGDGATSTDENPSHTYSGPGNYTVILTASNGQCQHTTKRNVVVIKEQGTLAFSDSVSCLNTRIIFNVKDINANNISTYNWYFDSLGGNVIVTTNNPVAWSFNIPGTRHSAVVLTDILKCKDTLYTVVPVISYGPRTSFESVAPNTCFGNTINFTDTTITDGIHPITEYLWNYGEATPQRYTAGPFSHDYAATGTYTVKLVVTDSYGCKDSMTRPAFVSITKPVAKFTVSDTSLCPSTPVTFTNESAGVKAAYHWDFGDGTTSTAVSPVHSFGAAGSYKVTMDMVDVNGCTASDSAIINVYSAKADFAMSDSFKSCPELTVNITNLSSNYVNLNWDFGDGGNSQLTNPSHVYSYPGNYTVKLTVTNTGGCADELTKKVVIQGPTGTFDYLPKQSCNPGKVDFAITSQNNAVSYVWDFQDGNTIFSTLPNVSHTYIDSGSYVPRIILLDASGCQVAIKGLDTVKVYSINTNILSDTKMLCDSGFVAFRDSSVSNDLLGSFAWNFGDGTTSTLQNPTHHFADTGFYSVKLVSTTRFGCKDSSFLQNYVKVVNSPSIKMLGDASACEPAKIQLAADFIVKDTSAVTWDWNFGNGSISNQQKPDSQVYTQSGSYQVTVKATNSDGCSSVVTNTAVIHPKPVVDAGPDATICRFAPYTLTATGADSYAWSSNPSLNCTNCATPTAKPDSAITYHVTGKTLFGCTNEDSVTLKVQQPIKLVVPNSDTLCKGESVTLKTSGADIYQWTPSLWLTNSTSSSPVARPDTSITYQVIGKDLNGCFNDTQNVRIKVYPIPSVEIINGDNVTVQVGGFIKLNTKSSPDVINWKWFPSQGLSCASCSEPLASPKESITYSVTATNEGKCEAKDQVTLNLICNNANVYMPNTFSPNADGVNDVFYPRGTGLFNILTFRIFNRWGQLVFQKNGGNANSPLDGWDGTLNGLPLQPDVYVYLLEVVCSNNTIFPFKGNVSLIR